MTPHKGGIQEAGAPAQEMQNYHEVEDFEEEEEPKDLTDQEFNSLTL